MSGDSTHLTLSGTHVRLEPLARSHINALVAAAGQDLELYQWSAVPLTATEMAHYVETATREREAGTALPFATVRCQTSRRAIRRAFPSLPRSGRR